MGTIVQRLPADKPGDEIISSILTDPASQLERGTYEINHNMDDRVTVIGSLQGLEYIIQGIMAKVVIKGVEKIGLVSQVTGHVSISKKSLKINQQIKVETIK